MNYSWKQRLEASACHRQRFSIRKVAAVGAVSAMIGTAVFMTGSGVYAEEVYPQSTQALDGISTQLPKESITQEMPTDTTSETVEISDAVSPSENIPEEQEQSVESPNATTELNNSVSHDVSEKQSFEAPIGDNAEIAESERVDTVLTSLSVANNKIQEEPTVSAKLEDNYLYLHYQAEIPKDQVLKFAVWTENKGQDDLVWYEADATGAAYIDLSKRHREYGLYNIHTYIFDRNGNITSFNARTYTVDFPQVEAKISESENNQLEITVSKVPDDIVSVTVPIWSDRNGQDDIKWLAATNMGGGTFKVLAPVSEYGHYSVHVYGRSLITGGLVGLMATNGFDHKDTRVDAEVALDKYAENKTNFDIVINIGRNTKPVKSIAIAAWSQQGGQDDLKWYTPVIRSGSSQVRQTIDIADLSNTSDTYSIHTYVYYQDGSYSGIALSPVKITKPQNKTEVTTTLMENGIFLKAVSNQVKDYSKIKFAVWSVENGQDDIVWYAADSRGEAFAPYSNHKGLGTYNIHVYDCSKGAIGLKAATVTLPNPTAKTMIEKVTQGTYKVTVTEVPAYIQTIILPAWSELNGQDDIKWTEATRQADGSFVGLIRLSDHGLNAGHYNVHVYGKSPLTSNLIGLMVTSGFDVAEDDVPKQTGIVSVGNFNSNNLTFATYIDDVSNIRGVKDVLVAVWSESNGQDDIVWETAIRQADGSYLAVTDLSRHHFESGLYNIHTYYRLLDGSMSGVAQNTITINTPKLIGIAAQIYGSNNFVPSVNIRNELANAIQAIKNQGYQVGFVLFDANTKKGLSYNCNQKFYVASSIKGAYVASVVAQNPSALSVDRETIQNILYYSDNAAYVALRNKYGTQPISNWMRQAGIDTSMAFPNYPNITANELSKLWEQNYNFFNTSDTGRQLAQLYTRPNLSPIHYVLGNTYTTMSKAGWIGMPGYHAANDAGIVKTSKGDYILAITSNADGKLGLLNQLVSTLNKAYLEI